MLNVAFDVRGLVFVAAIYVRGKKVNININNVNRDINKSSFLRANNGEQIYRRADDPVRLSVFGPLLPLLHSPFSFSHLLKLRQTPIVDSSHTKHYYFHSRASFNDRLQEVLSYAQIS